MSSASCSMVLHSINAMRGSPPAVLGQAAHGAAQGARTGAVYV